MRNNDLAIICPVLNCVKYTKDFLEQVVKFINCPIIIIDNASSDGTLAYLRSWEKAGNVMVVKNKVNAGVACSWNQGILMARMRYKSKYFFIPNNDILLQSDTIGKMLEVLKQPDIALTSAFNVKDEIKNPRALPFAVPPLKLDLVEAPDFSCFMIKGETIEKVGYFDENFYPAYFEDNDYHRRINFAGMKAVKLNTALYYHYGSMTIKEGADIKRLSNAHYLKNEDYYRKKWGGTPGKETFETPFNK